MRHWLKLAGFLLLASIVALLLHFRLAAYHGITNEAKARYAEITPEMTPRDVEALIGWPCAEHDDDGREAWNFGWVRQISVHYDADNKVVKKYLFNTEAADWRTVIGSCEASEWYDK